MIVELTVYDLTPQITDGEITCTENQSRRNGHSLFPAVS